MRVGVRVGLRAEVGLPLLEGIEPAAQVGARLVRVRVRVRVRARARARVRVRVRVRVRPLSGTSLPPSVMLSLAMIQSNMPE